MNKTGGWKDWIDGPLGHTLRGATYGGALGWLYDKFRDRKGKEKGKNTLRRMAIGALTGSLAGSAYYNYKDNAVVGDRAGGAGSHDSSAAGNKAELERIAGMLGIKTDGKTAYDLASDIRYKLDNETVVPELLSSGEFDKAAKKLNTVAEDALRAYQLFISGLQGKRVIALPNE